MVKLTSHNSIATAISLILTGLLSSSAISKEKNPLNPAYIQNGKVRLGVDLGAGGGIFYFSETSPERNLLNHHDKGRFIQQSYYGIKDGSNWNGKPWRWNPVQGGNWKGESAKVLEATISQDHLYVKTMPKQWGTGGSLGDDVKDAVMEEWIDLSGNVAKIHFRFTYSGSVDHPEEDAELPAFYADGDLTNLVMYSGKTPWSGDKTTHLAPGWPNHGGKSTECWAAYLDDKSWGLGLFFPETTEMTFFRFTGDGKTGSEGDACSYFAPISKLTITKGFVYDYTIYLTIGTVIEIRDRFKTIHAGLFQHTG